jgi:small subunit ribosomal protein S18
MAKPRGRARSKTKGRKGGAPAQRKRRPQLGLEEIDWKNFPSLRRFVSERGKIRSRRITGLSRRQQSLVAKAVKRARTMGLLPYPDQDRKIRH